MKNLSRSKILSMLALPLIAVAVRKLESKSSPRNRAITRWPESRKVKLPCLRLTRRTSGVNGVSGRGFAVISLGEPVAASAGGAVAGAMPDTGGGGVAAVFSGGNSGRRHLPAAFCAQITSGLINETCRMTRRLLKSDQNFTRS